MSVFATWRQVKSCFVVQLRKKRAGKRKRRVLVIFWKPYRSNHSIIFYTNNFEKNKKKKSWKQFDKKKRIYRQANCRDNEEKKGVGNLNNMKSELFGWWEA